jgi:hypothetical protein
LNVYLGVRVRAAKPGVGQSPSLVATGARAPNLHAEELDGKKMVIDWDVKAIGSLRFLPVVCLVSAQ